MTITLQAVNELIQSLESAGELSIREQKFLKLAKEFSICSASLDAAIKTGNMLADQNAQLAAENVALVEALEKAQQLATQQGNIACALFDEVTAQRQRIAGLESRTVTVKQGEVLVTVAGFTGCGKSAIAGEIEIAMKAIGLPVAWANGDSEKRMTGADWLTAIEMYKPTVRIVEVNIPRRWHQGGG